MTAAHDGGPGEGAADAILLDEPTTADLRGKVTEAWREFARALAQLHPEALPVGARVELTLDPTASGTGDAVYSVRCGPCARTVMVEALAVGNAGLPEGYRLDRAAVADLVALGWSPPGVVAGSGDQFGLRTPVADARPYRRRPSRARCATCTARRTRPSWSTSCTTPRTSRSPSTRWAPRGPSRRPRQTSSGPRRGDAAGTAAAARGRRGRHRRWTSGSARSSPRCTKTDAGAAAGRLRRRHRHPGRLGDGLRPGPRQPAAGRRLLAGPDRGRADRAAVREAVRADQPDADRPAVLHQRHRLGVDPGVRPQLPGHPPHARRAGDDRARRRARRPAARRVRRQAVLRRGRQAGRSAKPASTAPACTSRAQSGGAPDRPIAVRPGHPEAQANGSQASRVVASMVRSVAVQPGVRDRPQCRRRSSASGGSCAGSTSRDCGAGPRPTSVDRCRHPQHQRAAVGRTRSAP